MTKTKLINFFLFFITLLLCFTIAEYVFRKIIFNKNADLKDLQNASKYANPLSQDYWILNHQFEKTYLPPPNPHPLLGWVGFFNRETYNHNDIDKAGDKRKVLIYGDSFVMCVDTVLCFEEILNNDTTFSKNNYLLNYGVGGYGVDQIFMLCSLTVSKYQNPFVVFSIMPADMDRSILHFRIGQKPYYEIENNQLILKGIPIENSTENYLKQHPVSFTSYLWQKFKYSNINFLHNQIKEDEPYHKDIIELNSKIIKETDIFLKSQNVDYTFMLFDNMYNADGEWRLEFLKAFMNENHIPFFVTSDLVKADKTFPEYNFDNYIIKGNGHPNTHYNNLVCAEIKRKIGIINSEFITPSPANEKENENYWVAKIKSDKKWLNDIAKKANERKIPLDSMILLDARWMVEQGKNEN